MAPKKTNRTATAAWKRTRQRAIRAATIGGVITCQGCGAILDPTAPPHTPTAIEVDHIMAVSHGGAEFAAENLQVLCHPCNRRKSSRDYVPAPGTRRERTPTYDRFGNRWLPGWYAEVRATGCQLHGEDIRVGCPHSKSLVR